MSEIDWSQAPEGATHYCAKGSSHNGMEYGEHWLKPGFYRLPHWKKWEEDKCRAPESILVARPSPAWSGDGLPPVGTVCLYKHNSTERMRVCAVDGKWAAMSSEFSKFWCQINELLPIRTPEQIAADEREAVVREMMGHVRTCLPRELWDESRPACFTLYDAGYRKP